LQYYEEIGKPTPKVEVMKYLKGKQYVDAKDFAGECEAVVVVAKGQGRCFISFSSRTIPVQLRCERDVIGCYLNLLPCHGWISDVQGTCKYGTRVDYILASPSSPYKFVPGSYTVISSKGTSDHHIVRVDVTIPEIKETDTETVNRKQRVVRVSKKSSRKGIWGSK
jgi:hypothetical protein